MAPYKTFQSQKASFDTIKNFVFTQLGTTFLIDDDLLNITGKSLAALGFAKADTKAEIAVYCKEMLSIRIPAVDRVSDDSAIDMYNNLILNISDAPGVLKKQLLAQAQSDMQKVAELIDTYEKIPVIQEINASQRSSPRNHEERTIHEFYQRTLKKREEIQNYLASEIDEISIRYASKSYKEMIRRSGMNQGMLSKNINFPYMDLVVYDYKFDFEVDFEMLDHSKINPYKNKMAVFKFDNDIRTTPSAVLDQEIADKLDAEKMMGELVDQLKRIPRVNGRAEIFDEMNTLCKQKLWYAFYALALPQVEGIFAELLSIVDPNYRATGTLTDKANLLRTSAQTGSFDFDYYAFYLPSSRNKFAHTGKDTGIPLKCMHMILDLKHLLETAEGLDSPLIGLNNIVTEGKNSFNHMGDLSNMLVLNEKSRGHEHYEEVKNKLDVMVYDDFLNHFDLIGFLQAMSKQFDTSLDKFNQLLPSGYLGKAEKAPDFLSLSPAEVKDRLQELQGAISEVYLLTEDIKIVLDIHYFVSNVHKVFTKLPDKIIAALEDFKLQKKAVWAQLSIISSNSKLELMDDYMVQKKDMMHLFNQYLSS